MEIDALTRDVFAEAFVLHRRPYRESSLLVDFLTRDDGLVSAVARSGRRRGVTPFEPFRPVAIRWSGRGELKTLVQVEARGSLPPIPAAVVWSGLYANELLLRLCARFDAYPVLFDAYGVLVQGLSQLRRTGADTAVVREQWLLRIFEKTLLDALGYGLMLTHDAQTNAPICAEQLYEYDVERGPIPVLVDCAGGRGLRIQGRTLQALAEERFDIMSDLTEAKYLLRAAIDARLGSKVLHSRQLRRAVEQVQQQASQITLTEY